MGMHENIRVERGFFFPGFSVSKVGGFFSAAGGGGVLGMRKESCSDGERERERAPRENLIGVQRRGKTKIEVSVTLLEDAI